jgi:hypothetical protein
VRMERRMYSTTRAAARKYAAEAMADRVLRRRLV